MLTTQMAFLILSFLKALFCHILLINMSVAMRRAMVAGMLE